MIVTHVEHLVQRPTYVTSRDGSNSAIEDWMIPPPKLVIHPYANIIKKWCPTAELVVQLAARI